MLKEFSNFGKDHFGIITFLLTGLGICGQLVIAYFFNKRAERFKAELQTQAADYQAKLNQFAFKNQTQFAQLHLERANVIKTLFDQLMLTEEMLQFLADSIDKKQAVERYDSTTNSIQAFRACERKYRIYFQSAFATKLRDLVPLSEEHALAILKTFTLQGENVRQRHNETWIGTKLEINKILDNLENEFRILLGVEEDKKVP